MHQFVDWSNFPGMDQRADLGLASVGAYDAKARLSELLDRVERGEHIIITRHGRPVARLVPDREPDTIAARAALTRLVALGERLTARGVDLSDEEVRSLREEGRR